MRTRAFFPQEALDIWMADDHVDLSTEELTLKPEGRRFRVVEAVLVLRELTGAPDPNELVGKVKSRAYLAEFSAEVMEGSMIIGDNAYDVVQGFVGAPIPSFDEYQAQNPTPGVANDEELLAAFAKRTG